MLPNQSYVYLACVHKRRFALVESSSCFTALAQLIDLASVCCGHTEPFFCPETFWKVLHCRGHGTCMADGKLVASVCGVVERVNKLVSVRPLKSRYDARTKTRKKCEYIASCRCSRYCCDQWHTWFSRRSLGCQCPCGCGSVVTRYIQIQMCLAVPDTVKPKHTIQQTSYGRRSPPPRLNRSPFNRNSSYTGHFVVLPTIK